MTDGFLMRLKKPFDEKASAKVSASKELRSVTRKYMLSCSLSSERIVACVVGSDGLDWANAMSYMGSRVCFVSRTLRKGSMLGVNHVLFQRLLDTELALRVLVDSASSVFYEYDAMRVLGDEATVCVDGVVWFRIGLGLRVPSRAEQEREQ